MYNENFYSTAWLGTFLYVIVTAETLRYYNAKLTPNNHEVPAELQDPQNPGGVTRIFRDRRQLMAP